MNRFDDQLQKNRPFEKDFYLNGKGIVHVSVEPRATGSCVMTAKSELPIAHIFIGKDGKRLKDMRCQNPRNWRITFCDGEIPWNTHNMATLGIETVPGGKYNLRLS